MEKYVLDRHKAGAFLKGWDGALITLKENLEKEAKEADANLTRAREVEEESDYSDAMLSMDRTYAEGFADALGVAIRLLEEEAGN